MSTFDPEFERSGKKGRIAAETGVATSLADNFGRPV
jgi:hypothetical protein